MMIALPYLPKLLQGWLPPERFFETYDGDVSIRMALACTGSLTRYLEEQTGHMVQLKIESQELLSTWEGNARLWNKCHALPENGMMLSRNAWLLLAGQERIFAHSQVVISALPLEVKLAIEQGEEPLGSLFLEREGSVERVDLELAGAHVPDLAVRLGHKADLVFWCRRSLFCVNHQTRARILEIFLPSEP